MKFDLPITNTIRKHPCFQLGKKEREAEIIKIIENIPCFGKWLKNRCAIDFSNDLIKQIKEQKE